MISPLRNKDTVAIKLRILVVVFKLNSLKMKSFLLFVAIASLLVSTSAIAQITGNIAPELGVSVSSFPHVHKDESDYGWDRDAWWPLPGPLAGVHGNVFLGKHFHFSASFQYQLMGSRYRSHSNSFHPWENSTSTSDSWRKETYHKLCMPIEFGYQFRIRKIYPSIQLGYRFNYFLGGTYY